MSISEGPFDDVPLRARLIGWGILMGPLLLLVVLGMQLLRPAPMPRKAVLGCYRNSDAPWLRVEETKILIGDDTGRFFRFVAEPAKTGYRLAVQPAMTLHLGSDGLYHFESRRGVGYFWSLLTASSDRPRAMRSPDDFGGRFSLTADDGSERIYVRAPSLAACR